MIVCIYKDDWASSKTEKGNKKCDMKPLATIPSDIFQLATFLWVIVPFMYVKVNCAADPDMNYKVLI